MARVFTVDFEFKGNQHMAMVSTWGRDAQSYVIQISLHDDGLQDLVPDGVLRFSTADNGLYANAEQAELVHCLKHVVKSHLQKLSIQTQLL